MQKASNSNETEHRNIVSEYFKLVAARKFEESLKFFSPNCKTHNPYIKGNMKTLADAQKAASKDMPNTQNASFLVKNLLTEGETVAAFTELLFKKANPGEGGLRQVHVFRFEGDKIVEYWDVTQMVTNDLPNAAGAF
jgi:predicted SnoaL-like aldol condensation-catalyzing enzyme